MCDRVIIIFLWVISFFMLMLCVVVVILVWCVLLKLVWIVFSFLWIIFIKCFVFVRMCINVVIFLRSCLYLLRIFLCFRLVSLCRCRFRIVCVCCLVRKYLLLWMLYCGLSYLGCVVFVFVCLSIVVMLLRF